MEAKALEWKREDRETPSDGHHREEFSRWEMIKPWNFAESPELWGRSVILLCWRWRQDSNPSSATKWVWGQSKLHEIVTNVVKQQGNMKGEVSVAPRWTLKMHVLKKKPGRTRFQMDDSVYTQSGSKPGKNRLQLLKSELGCGSGRLGFFQC